MNFCVTFKTGDYRKAITYRESETGGLNHLDEARQRIGTNFSAELFRGIFERLYESKYTVTITEEEARESGRAQESSTVNVTVPEGFLDKYTETYLDCDRKEKNDAIKSVQFKWRVNEAALMAAWEEAGYPLKWGFKE